MFTEILQKLPVTPNRNKAAASCHALVQSASRIMATEYRGSEKCIMLLLPYFPTRYPDTGMVHICPAGKANRMEPIAPSESSNTVLMSGIRLAQDAKHRPWKK
ncbi:hypothetical protein D9M69_575750 [compost metagenome]